MDTKTRDFSGNFSRGSTRALVETMCSVFLWNSYPKMWTNEQKGAHLGTKPFAMLKLLKWNCKVRRIMPTAWGCTRPTSTAMSGCPGTAMPCLQSHVHLVGRNPQVLSCQQSSDLNSQWTQELSTSGINICLTYIQRHRWSGFKTDCFISSGSWGLKPGINTVFSVRAPTTLPQDVFRNPFATTCLHWLQWSALLWPQGPWNPGPPEFSLWPWDSWFRTATPNVPRNRT